MELRHDDFVIGKNTGQEEFPNHVNTLGKFAKLQDFLMVLDGDSRHMEAKIRTVAARYGQDVQPLFLPGDKAPETWIWEALSRHAGVYAEELGLTATDLTERMQQIQRLTEGGVQQRDRVKAALSALADEINRTPVDVARIVARVETQANRRELAVFRVEIQEQIEVWRRRSS